MKRSWILITCLVVAVIWMVSSGKKDDGVMAAIIAAVLTYWLTNEQQKEAEAQRRKSDALAALNAIKAELDANWKTFDKYLAPPLRDVKEGEPLYRCLLPSNFNPFIIYESNAARLGDLENQVLVLDMVATISKARNFLDRYHHYTSESNRTEEHRLTEPVTERIYYVEGNVKKYMVKLTADLKRDEQDLTIIVPELIAAISEEQAKHK